MIERYIEMGPDSLKYRIERNAGKPVLDNLVIVQVKGTEKYIVRSKRMGFRRFVSIINAITDEEVVSFNFNWLPNTLSYGKFELQVKGKPYGKISISLPFFCSPLA